MPLLFLLDNTCLFKGLDKIKAAAIKPGDLIIIDLDNEIIDLSSGKRRGERS
jgi:hypothetical protein